MPASRPDRRRRRRRLSLPVRIERFDERVASRVNARTTGAAVDGFWRGLTRFADHGKLWLLVAAVLLASGKYRAAYRGLISLGLASAIANLVGKRIVGGDRPALTAIPISRRLDRSPTSPSFPSGHTASAFAFAAGAALESPKAGAAIAPLAAAVGYSRLHTGAHWFSDVAGGALIGAGAAIAGKVLVPAGRPPRLPRRTEAPTATTIDLPALPDGDGLFILINPNSGRDLERPSPLPRLRERLPKAVVHELSEGDDFEKLVDDALASSAPPQVLGIYGGDGSVGALASIARRHDLPLLALPGGTFNHFAKAAAVDTLDRGIDALVAGTGRAVDVGELTFGAGGGKPITVLNTASVGLYPEFVEARERRENRLGKPVAAAIAAFTIVRATDPLDVEINGKRSRVWSIFIGIDRYYPVTVAPIERRRLDDGLLDVRILHADGKPRTRGTVALAFGSKLDHLTARLPSLQGPPAVEAFTAQEITLVSRAGDGSDPGYAHDGEASHETPGTDGGSGHTLHIRIVPGGLRVYSPIVHGEAG
ncbi:phosphatase PAP2 family protein [Leifsonia sp. NPDC058230]|uniref:bifunctional phosphatase PAP2/diacylglycerol kinase family protein n=1 Tax=Leifsonia sp. NPDC058230 TaxID=3346391 RepID=UPI0036D9F502